MRRLGETALSVLIALDQLLQTLFTAPFALAGMAAIPDPDATISGLLGRHAAKDRKWAKFAAVLVDVLFLVLTLGRERNHCQRTALREAHRCTAIAWMPDNLQADT